MKETDLFPNELAIKIIEKITEFNDKSFLPATTIRLPPWRIWGLHVILDPNLSGDEIVIESGVDYEI